MAVSRNIVAKRLAFEQRAIKEARQRLGLPVGWFGDYEHAYGQRDLHVAEVHFIRGGGWRVMLDGGLISKHDSRAFAIKKAARLLNRA